MSSSLKGRSQSLSHTERGGSSQLSPESFLIFSHPGRSSLPLSPAILHLPLHIIPSLTQTRGRKKQTNPEAGAKQEREIKSNRKIKIINEKRENDKEGEINKKFPILRLSIVYLKIIQSIHSRGVS